jgi:hypothetical protein
MKTRNNFMKFWSLMALIVVSILLVMPDTADARGGSFGGSRSFGGRSFGGRSFSKPAPSSPSTPRSSFSKPGTGGMSSPMRMTPSQRAASSFGGKRLSSSSDYTGKYGVPRKTETFARTNAQGLSQNYVIHSYGGFGSGLMMGYMMGHTPWYWYTPFHPAFFYSRPYYADNPDGTVSVYPPTFDWGKLIFTIIIFAAIIYIIYAIIRSRRRRKQGYSQSSFG